MLKIEVSHSSKVNGCFTKELGFSRLLGTKLLAVLQGKNLSDSMEKLGIGQEPDTHTTSTDCLHSSQLIQRRHK